MHGTHDLRSSFAACRGADVPCPGPFERGLSVECRPLRRRARVVVLSPCRLRGSITYRRSFCAERRPRYQALTPTPTSAVKKHAPVMAVRFILVLSFTFSSIMRRPLALTSGSSLYFPGLSARDCCCSGHVFINLCLAIIAAVAVPDFVELLFCIVRDSVVFRVHRCSSLSGNTAYSNRFQLCEIKMPGVFWSAHAFFCAGETV